MSLPAVPLMVAAIATPASERNKTPTTASSIVVLLIRYLPPRLRTTLSACARRLCPSRSGRDRCLARQRQRGPRGLVEDQGLGDRHPREGGALGGDPEPPQLRHLGVPGVLLPYPLVSVLLVHLGRLDADGLHRAEDRVPRDLHDVVAMLVGVEVLDVGVVGVHLVGELAHVGLRRGAE